MYAFVILYSIYYFFAANNSKVYSNNFVYKLNCFEKLKTLEEDIKGKKQFLT